MNARAEDRVELSPDELLELAAVDQEFYCRHFFPKAFRQPSPSFHADFWARIEDPTKDLFAAEIFRGGAKTTLARAAISRRIAYGISRNILSVAINEAMSINSLRWLKKQVEFNTLWAQTFKLTPGGKWADDWIEIYHGIYQHSINVVAKGMTSGLRGLNLDEWRPDFILCDDICNEENTATPEQRTKTNELLFGALVPSLAPKIEAPLRKLVLIQTGLHKEDAINLAHKDDAWHTVKYPLITYDENGAALSAWEELYPIQDVLAQKENYTRQRRLHIWLREFGLKLVSGETSAFDPTWLKYWTVLPVGIRVYLGLDPATDSPSKKAHKTAAVGIGVFRGGVYILDYLNQAGKNPDELWAWIYGFVRQWHPLMSAVETVAFQRVLKWYLEKKMQESQFFFAIRSFDDRRSKPNRIRQAYTGLASNGQLYVHENHTEFVQAFTEYADNVDSDLLDAGAIAICAANPWMLRGADLVEGDEDVEELDYIEIEERAIPSLGWEGGAP